MAAYAIVGGIPAYLSWLNPRQTLTTNIKNVMLAPGSLVLAEAAFLLQDEVREPRPYLTVLQALGNGHHTLKEIANASMIATAHPSSYLSQLQELRLVERRLPATLTHAEQRRSRMGRYHLSDPFLRFYFRFLAPAAAAATLGFLPQTVGSHWSRMVQTDVVAVSWQERSILIGECKWGADAVNRQTVRHLLDQTIPKTVAALPEAGQGWRVIPALFARSGATPDAQALVQEHGGLLVDLPTLYRDLGEDAG